jgi:hypothetical protein
VCFYNDDYDWIASINDTTCVQGTVADRCYECRRPIDAGEWRVSIYQQEHEACQICEDEDSDEFDQQIHQNECIHDFGETFSAVICRQCSLLREAIYDLERIENCPEHARQPRIGALQDEMGEDDGKYARHAVAIFPELSTHKLCANCL